MHRAVKVAVIVAVVAAFAVAGLYLRPHESTSSECDKTICQLLR